VRVLRVARAAAACTAGVAALGLVAGLPAAGAAPDPGVPSGLGRYYAQPRDGAAGIDVTPPPAAFRAGAAARVAAPTNQWYSSLMFQRWSRPLYALPLTGLAGASGFELGVPSPKLHVHPKNGTREMRFLHEPALTVAPLAFEPRDARLARFSDWLAGVRMGDGRGSALEVTLLHGSPFAYFECSQGDVAIRLAAAPRRLEPVAGTESRVASFVVGTHAFAVFAPRGARFSWPDPATLLLHLSQARYFSIAALPDETPATRAAFLAVAYAFPIDTRAEWSYDERASAVHTIFRVTTRAREGDTDDTFLGLYPHHWSALKPAAALYRYDSVRGPIRVIRGRSFEIVRPYHGFVPYWPALAAGADRERLDALLAEDLRRAGERVALAGGTYWTGKGLGALAQLAGIAAAEGRPQARDAVLGALKGAMQAWFDGRHAGYFLKDARLGTFVGIPQEYNSVQNMNDHHFHYGYWITAAAHVALRDPEWLARDRWGGMLGELVADIATAERGRADYPFLRHFDAYEGHSWASGTANLLAGNNQESSSEAINAWAGLILLGEATGNTALRDLGIYLYTSEIASVEQYWLDLDHSVLAPAFGERYASLVFGGKYAYATWWTAEPRQLLGINVLPVTPASTYLAADPGFVREALADLPAKMRAYAAQGETDGTPPDIWQDVLASFRGLADPDGARAEWNPQGSVEFGETRSHTFHWLASLQALGTPDLSVAADAPLAAVFRDRDGARTYLAYNAQATPRRVTFTTGVVLDVPPHALARAP